MISPDVVHLPILWPSVNQRLPSEPAVIDCGEPSQGSENSTSSPPVLIRPIAWFAVYQRLPSGPVTMSRAGPPRVRNSVIS